MQNINEFYDSHKVSVRDRIEMMLSSAEAKAADARKNSAALLEQARYYEDQARQLRDMLDGRALSNGDSQ